MKIFALPARQLLALITAFAMGCGLADHNNVSIDLVALYQQAALRGDILDVVEVRVSGDGIRTPVTAQVDAAQKSFEIWVPAGRERTFELEGFRQAGADNIPSYWGETLVDVPPGQTIEVVIPAYAVGRLLGNVSIEPAGIELPSSFQFSLTPLAPAEGQSAVEHIAVTGGVFRERIIAGTYQVSASLELSGVIFEAPADLTWNVEAGHNNSQALVLGSDGASLVVAIAGLPDDVDINIQETVSGSVLTSIGNGNHSVPHEFSFGDEFNIVVDAAAHAAVTHCQALPASGVLTSHLVVHVWCLGAVAPLFDTAANPRSFFTHVTNDGEDLLGASGADCTWSLLGDGQGEPISESPLPGSRPCFHAGLMRHVDLSRLPIAACNEIAAISDSLGGLAWRCEDRAEGPVVYSAGLDEAARLYDLLDASDEAALGWRPNSVRITTADGVLRTLMSVWWDNPVELANEPDTLAEINEIFLEPGVVRLVTAVEADVSFDASSDAVAVVVAPGASVRNGSLFGTFEAKGGSETAVRFLWMEGGEWSSTNSSDFFITLSDVAFATIRNITLSGQHARIELWSTHYADILNIDAIPDIDGSSQARVHLAGTSVGNRLSNIRIHHTSNTAIRVAGAYDTVISNAVISGAPIGLYSEYSELLTIRDSIFAANNYGVDILSVYMLQLHNVHANNNLMDGVRLNGISNANLHRLALHNNGASGMNSDSLNGIFSHITAANNYDAGFALNGAGNTYVSLAAINSLHGFRLDGNNEFDSQFHDIALLGNDYGFASYGEGSLGHDLLRFTGSFTTGQNNVDCFIILRDSPLAPGIFAEEGACGFEAGEAPEVAVADTLEDTFVARVVDDGGVEVRTVPQDMTEWVDDEQPWFRVWVPDGESYAYPFMTHRGPCGNASECALLDFRLANDDLALRNRAILDPNTLLHEWFVSPEICTTHLPGGQLIEVEMEPGCFALVHRGYTELSGNGNGLCEAGEECLLTPNVGYYQGEGPVEAAGQADFEMGAADVFVHSQNGGGPANPGGETAQ